MRSDDRGESGPRAGDKTHRWVVLVFAAVDDEHAAKFAQHADPDEVIGARPPLGALSAACYDCQQPFREADPVCPAEAQRRGYPA